MERVGCWTFDFPEQTLCNHFTTVVLVVKTWCTHGITKDND